MFVCVCNLMYFLEEFSKKKKHLNIKRNDSPFSGSPVVPCGRTDRHDEANSRLFANFANGPKNPKESYHKGVNAMTAIRVA